MTLPREIRDNVYEHAFPSHLSPSLEAMQKVLLRAQPFFHFKYHSSERHLLDQAHREAREQFLNNVTVELEFSCNSIMDSFRDMGSAKLYDLLNQVRHLVIRVQGLSISNPYDGTGTLTSLEGSLRNLSACKNLQTLTLGIWLPTQKQNQTKDCLETLRKTCETLKDLLDGKLRFAIDSPFPLEEYPRSKVCGYWQRWNGDFADLQGLIGRLEAG